MKQILKNIYYGYIRLLNLICGRQRNSILQKGDSCEIELLEPNDSTFGDIVHPCIRYIPEGFRGHHWWMVYTPYYGFNNKIENPRLCFGVEDSRSVTVAPKKWVMVEEIEKGKDVGYNSDPTMIFYDKSLYVYWRENFTERTTSSGNMRATFCKVYTEKGTVNVSEPILTELSRYEDKEMCPTFLIYNNNFYCYGVDYRFALERWSNSVFINKITTVLGKFGVYSQAKSKGIALWVGKTLKSKFDYLETYQIQNVNKLYKPWHMDLFTYKELVYAVILSNNSRGDICLAVSDDGREFRMFKKPLLTNKSLECIEIYKSSAVVVDEVFYLYYTVRNIVNPSLNKMYVTSCPFTQLINALE